MILKNKKGSVVKVALAVSLATSITLGCINVVSSERVEELTTQLGKTQIELSDSVSDYKSLEGQYLQIESESQELLERQEELNSTISQLAEEKDSLQSQLEKKSSELNELKKKKVDEEKKVKPSTSSTTKSLGNYSSWNKMTVSATGYTTYENGDKLAGKWGNITASGTVPKWGTIAVDTNLIPFGTRIYIPSLNLVGIAEDTGSAIKGNKIDVFFNSYNEAIQFGRQSIEIYVDL